MPLQNELPLFRVRRSRIAGLGAFALRPIPKGTRIIEYLGERVSHAEADRRYEHSEDDSHVVLFTVNSRTVIDAGVDGNDARFINHSCNPNCEANIERGHVYIDSIRAIEPGEELFYDYSLTRDHLESAEEEAKYTCRCGSAKCRGTMLEPKPKRRVRVRAKSGVKAGSRSRRAVK